MNITIIRDFLVENEEMFFFGINPSQDDPAVILGQSTLSQVIIVDEEDGIIFGYL